MHAPMQCFHYLQGYFAMAVSYEHKIFMTLSPLVKFVGILR
jgi:hypothetical protein